LRCSDLPDIPRDHFRVADDSSVATRRNPNTEGLGLELTGVELTDREYIKVNERLQTTAPGVWAIGEVAGSPQFTHISVDDFRVVHTNLTGGNRMTTGRQVPYCLFTDPELARIGLSEAEAQVRGIAYRLFKVPALRDAVLTHPTLAEGLIPLFSSAASAHNVVETRGAQISAA
jgi:pyruvate/2-oxoglutarate dehydrogenase complex dihydrolipoamide dehydrogenase (E3) component